MSAEPMSGGEILNNGLHPPHPHPHPHPHPSNVTDVNNMTGIATTIANVSAALTPQNPSKPNFEITHLLNVMAYREPTLVLIDGDNLKSLAYRKQINLVPIYKDLRDFFYNNCHCVRIKYYHPMLYNAESIPNNREIGWVHFMQTNGYDFVVRRYKPSGNASTAHYDTQQQNNTSISSSQYNTAVPSNHVEKSKSNMDSYIVTDMLAVLAEMPQVKHIILVSGDGDFIYPITRLKTHGVRVTIVSQSVKDNDSSTNRMLVREADMFVSIENLFEHLLAR